MRRLFIFETHYQDSVQNCTLLAKVAILSNSINRLKFKILVIDFISLLFYSFLALLLLLSD
ncbi:MAG: hypothetical protein COC06_03820 [Bacteroidales bacterium]|nr:MAG: hypothetical protein COC06_03820 [Bacteroidales bacterium]